MGGDNYPVDPGTRESGLHDNQRSGIFEPPQREQKLVSAGASRDDQIRVGSALSIAGGIANSARHNGTFTSRVLTQYRLAPALTRKRLPRPFS